MPGPSGFPIILNLGCGARTSPAFVNIDWSPLLRLKKSRLGSKIARRWLSGRRLENFNALDGTLVLHDLRRGIPASDSSVDAVYHSHVLEHLARDQVGRFFAEVRRVLKPGGVHRIVVPDLEFSARQYLAHLEDCVSGASNGLHRHDEYVAAIIEQMVRREAHGSSQQPPLRRLFENVLLGDARRRGETHQWMWDRVNLAHVLAEAGFLGIRVVDRSTSAIDNWHTIGLDTNEDGGDYKPGSLYIEARR